MDPGQREKRAVCGSSQWEWRSLKHRQYATRTKILENGTAIEAVILDLKQHCRTKEGTNPVHKIIYNFTWIFDCQCIFLNTSGNFVNPKNLIIYVNATPDSRYISKPSNNFVVNVCVISNVLQNLR